MPPANPLTCLTEYRSSLLDGKSSIKGRVLSASSNLLVLQRLGNLCRWLRTSAKSRSIIRVGPTCITGSQSNGLLTILKDWVSRMLRWLNFAIEKQPRLNNLHQENADGSTNPTLPLVSEEDRRTRRYRTSMLQTNYVKGPAYRTQWRNGTCSTSYMLITI